MLRIILSNNFYTQKCYVVDSINDLKKNESKRKRTKRPIETNLSEYGYAIFIYVTFYNII